MFEEQYRRELFQGQDQHWAGRGKQDANCKVLGVDFLGSSSSRALREGMAFQGWQEARVLYRRIPRDLLLMYY